MGRCVAPCELGCGAGMECVDAVCVPSSGGPMCPETVVSWGLCVGQAVEAPLANTLGRAPEGWVVLESHLPEGLTLDEQSGEVHGTPRTVASGSLWLRQGGPGAPELTIEMKAREHCAEVAAQRLDWCAGEPQSAVLSATDGGSGYGWRVRGLPDGVTLTGAELSGRVDEPATYPLSVTLLDAELVRDEAQVELVVVACDRGGGAPEQSPPRPSPLEEMEPLAQEDARAPKGLPAPESEAPQILTSALPPACVGQPYAPPSLEASGGAGAYIWSLRTGPEWLSMDATTGSFAGTPDRPGPWEVIVRVEDGEGATHEVSLVSNVEAAGAGSCERVPLGIATRVLPEACIGEEYYTRLEATGGGGNYVWRPFGELPAGLTLDPDGVLRGTVPVDAPLGPTTLTVRLSSSLFDQPLSATISSSIGVCNALAFIATDGEVERLFVAPYPSPELREVSREVLAPDQSVRSFRYSPTARTFAFLVDSLDAAGPARVYLADGFEGPARLVQWPTELGEEPSVIEYVWSMTGAHLALVARARDSVVLGAVAGGSSEITAVVDVGQRYLRDLFWASERVCYKAPGELSRQRNVLCHEVADGRVANEATSSGLFLATELDPATLLGGAEGYLAILPDRRQAYYRDVSSGMSSSHLEHVFSPSLRWAAGVTPGATGPQLRTSAPQRATQATRVLAELVGCDAPHAWSADDSTLACKTGDELHILELGAEGQIVRRSAVLASAGYPDGEFRRLFSPDGRWYAYDTGTELRLVDTESEAPITQQLGEHRDEAPYVGLGTDSAGTVLLYHHGNQLDLVHLGQSPLRVNLSGSVTLSEPLYCSSSYLSPGPARWCGASRLPGSFFPSRDGRGVAFLDTAGRLYITASGSGDARRLLDLPVNCTGEANELRCDDRVQWAPR